MAQRAILMILEPIYEGDFLPCSYGFRPGRSAHDALYALRTGIMERGQRWVIDADVSNYFGSISHTHLRAWGCHVSGSSRMARQRSPTSPQRANQLA